MKGLTVYYFNGGQGFFFLPSTNLSWGRIGSAHILYAHPLLREQRSSAIVKQTLKPSPFVITAVLAFQDRKI